MRKKFPPKIPQCCPQMPSYQKTASGGTRVQLEVLGERDSATFPTKREAQAWAAQRDTEIRAAKGGAGTAHTLLQGLRRYAEEESPKRRGERREIITLKAMEKETSGLPVKKRMSLVDDADIRSWRDHRLKTVSRGTVLREFGLLNSLFETARIEWKWVKVNPIKDVKKPTRPAHRKRIISGPEVRKVLRALGYHRGSVRSVSQAVSVAFLLALSTGMRTKEICQLRWADVHGDYGTARNVKSIHVGVDRDIPLTPVSMRLIERMRGWDDDVVFGLAEGTLDALFRRARKRAGLEGFTFHDSRHTAATRIGKAGKIHVLEMCKAFGWTKVDQAMVYFNPTASDIAKKL